MIRNRAMQKATKVAEKWKKQYYTDHNNKWYSSPQFPKGKAKRIYNQLVKLGSHPTPTDVELVIGNYSWTNETCFCCGNQQDTIEFVSVDTPYLDKETKFQICESCVLKAAKMFKSCYPN